MASIPWPGLITRPSKQSSLPPSGPRAREEHPALVEEERKDLVHASVDRQVEAGRFEQPLQFQRQIRQDHRQRQGHGRPRSGNGLAVSAFWIRLPAQDIPVGVVRNLSGFVITRRQRVLAKGHRRKAIGEDIAGLDQGPSLARQTEVPVPSASRPCWRRNSAPDRAISSHEARFSIRLQSMENIHTCRAWSQRNLSVSKTAPSRARHVKYPPCSRSTECRSKKAGHRRTARCDSAAPARKSSCS